MRRMIRVGLGVALVLALKVRVPPGRIPKLESEVFAVSRVVPVSVAGRGAALDELDEPDAPEDVELEDELDPVDDVELPEVDCKTC